MVALIENYNQYLRIYYDDGHHEIVDLALRDLAKILKQKNTYKNPILVGNDYLYPTQNKRDEECRWVNFQCLDDKNDYLIRVLKDKDIFYKVINEYLSQKRKQLMNAKDSE